METYLEKLNKEQLDAVLATGGPVLVLAGAGSGKTRVLTSRITYILEKGLAEPEQILAITFTNKAANEMKERVISLVGENANKMWISTIHSMCLRILRYSISRLDGYDKNFTVYSEVDKERVLKKVLQSLGIEDENGLKNAKAHIAYAKNNDISPDRYAIEGVYSDAKTYAKVYKLYEETLKSSNAMDFDDLLLKTKHLLEEDDDTRIYFATKFKYIHIDEFQDTNIVQYEIAKMLSSCWNNIFVVGDDDQSIYGWRGAEIKNILQFDKYYKNLQVFKLQQNYRSTKRIIELANSIIKNNTIRSKKELWTDNDNGDKITYYCGQEESNEARYVVNKINEYVSQGGEYKDCAILMRVNALTRSFEQELMHYAIPFKVFGGFKFFERKEIKDLTAYLRLIANPLDNDALLRIINTPKRSIGDKTINAVSDYAKENNCSCYEALCFVDKFNINNGAKSKLNEFKNLIRDLVLSQDKSLIDLVNYVIDKTNFLSQFDEPSEENESKKMNIDEFKNSVIEYSKANKNGDLQDYLGSIALYSDVDEADDGNYVTVATIHAVKGLEFKTVFVTGLEETIFPISRAVRDVSEMEEERRLMYVAVTRAQKKLYLSRSSSRYLYGSRQVLERSRFLKEVCNVLGIPSDDRASLMTGGTSSYDSSYSQNRYQNNTRNNYNDNQRYKSVYSDDSVYSSDVESNQTNTTTNFSKSFVSKQPQTTNNNKDVSKFTVGKHVLHKKFGEGIIISVHNSGNNVIADIAFKVGGVKSLAVNFAPLTLIG